MLSKSKSFSFQSRMPIALRKSPNQHPTYDNTGKSLYTRRRSSPCASRKPRRPGRCWKRRGRRRWCPWRASGRSWPWRAGATACGHALLMALHDPVGLLLHPLLCPLDVGADAMQQLGGIIVHLAVANLEFDKIKEKWAQLALTEQARQRIMEQEPCLSETELALRQQETTEARTLLEKEGERAQISIPPMTTREKVSIRSTLYGRRLHRRHVEQTCGIHRRLLSAIFILQNPPSQCFA